MRAWSTTVPISRKSTTNDGELTAKRICPGTEDDTLGVRLVFLKVQQMTDQHLDLRSVTPDAFHFADGFEEIRVDIVVPDDTSGLGSRFVKSRISSSSVVVGLIFNAELL